MSSTDSLDYRHIVSKIVKFRGKVGSPSCGGTGSLRGIICAPWSAHLAEGEMLLSIIGVHADSSHRLPLSIDQLLVK
ncbi:hypothetical protein AB672_00330 [Xylella taiwanensis]|nr:hypothetical protein AB672_00330 [Xylella taiwanensis]